VEAEATVKDKKKRPSDETARFEAEVRRVSERILKDETLLRSQKQPKPERWSQDSRNTAESPTEPGAAKEPTPPAPYRQGTGDSTTEPNDPSTNDVVQTNLQGEQLLIARRGWRISLTGVVLQALAVVLTAAGIVIALVGIWPNLRKLQLDVKQNQLVISSPQDRAEVGSGQKIRGQTPFPNLNHYIVVTLVRTGDIYVQKDAAQIAPDRTFSGEARFEDMPVTQDDELKLQVLAASSGISPGKLDQAALPDDVVFSEPVEVRWVRSPGGEIVIMTPVSGAEVGFNDTVLGKTAFTDLNHYIVVTPVNAGTTYVQDQPALVNSADGSFSGVARFGGAEGSRQQQFFVRVVVTRSILTPGPLINEPADAVHSNTITVTRRK
jgi:hypothetical protein